MDEQLNRLTQGSLTSMSPAAQGQTRVASTSSAPRDPTAVEVRIASLGQTAIALRHLQDRIAAALYRLQGPYPEPSEAEKRDDANPPHVFGKFDVVSDHLSVTLMKLSASVDQLERLV